MKWILEDIGPEQQLIKSVRDNTLIIVERDNAREIAAQIMALLNQTIPTGIICTVCDGAGCPECHEEKK